MDIGLTHVALPVADLRRSLAFYRAYAGMAVVHRRADAKTGVKVAWITDRTRPFVIVLIQHGRKQAQLRGWAHLGVGCPSRAHVDRLVRRARRAGIRCDGPHDSPYPVGYWAFITDPDGNNLELSFGQEVSVVVARRKARRPARRRSDKHQRASVASAARAGETSRHRNSTSSAPLHAG